ncbi:MAG: alanine racemase [Clostridia bacterium]|nr:alanine racemase [Clostridia bacterium]MBQ6613757.1 alanine racemase [Clostridia bacterium]
MNEKNLAEIDLSALKHNFTYLESKIHALSPETEPMCVVKADAYGHSAELCVPTLFEAGARHFAVSSIEEAEQIYSILDKQNQVAKSILILGYTPAESDNVKLLARHRITQAVYSLEYAKALSDELCALKEKGVLEEDDVIRCHLKLDSGMNRLGFDTHTEVADDTVKEICEVSKLLGIRIDGVFSHLACADEGEREKSVAQFERYNRIVTKCEENGVRFPTKHICNSAGALTLTDMYQSFVRLGIVLYGISPSDEVSDKNLIPVMRLKSRIAHIHRLHKGDCVSYGGEFTAESEMTVATIPIGYADGFLRAYKNGGTVIVGDKAARLLGRVCMDQCMVDVTDTPAKIGDWVYIFDESGENLHRLCKAAGTIPYEAICLLSKRVKRVKING